MFTGSEPSTGITQIPSSSSIVPKRCDLSHSRVEVAESLADVAGHLSFGPTKNYRSRIVPIPGFLSDLLAAHLTRDVVDDPEALVFTTPGGTPPRNSNFRRQIWYQAVEEAELSQGLRMHDLRHTCASLLAAADATPKAVQHHLGHSSITSHLFASFVATSHPPAVQMRTKTTVGMVFNGTQLSSWRGV